MLGLMRWYFNGGDDADGIEMEQLECQKYHELMSIRKLYYKPVDVLIDTYIQSVRDSIILSPISLSLQSPSTYNHHDSPTNASAAEAKKEAYHQFQLGKGRGSLYANPVRRTHSVWMHKDLDSLKQLENQSRLATDQSDVILRILRLRNEREATNVVQSQLSARKQHMRWEMRQIAEKQKKKEETASTSSSTETPSPPPPPSPPSVTTTTTTKPTTAYTRNLLKKR